MQKKLVEVLILYNVVFRSLRRFVSYTNAVCLNSTRNEASTDTNNTSYEKYRQQFIIG